MIGPSKLQAANSAKAAARYKKALGLRMEGLTYRGIGEEFGGVTPERARQMVSRGWRDANKIAMFANTERPPRIP